MRAKWHIRLRGAVHKGHSNTTHTDGSSTVHGWSLSDSSASWHAHCNDSGQEDTWIRIPR
jgi:hypothetical protein